MGFLCVFLVLLFLHSPVLSSQKTGYLSSGAGKKALVSHCQAVLSSRPEAPFSRVLRRVKVPPLQETGRQLRAKGFEEFYIAGMDEVSRLNTLSEALRQNKVNPDLTHIEDFASQVEEHISFFSEKPHLSGKSEFKNHKEMLKILSREARWRVKEGKVTYNWWMQWNLKMLDAVDTEHDLKNFKDTIILDMAKGAFKKGLFQPSDVIFLPIIKELGIMAFNLVTSKKLVLLGLVNEVTEVDGFLKFHPLKFFFHDISHGLDEDARRINDSREYQNFHLQFVKKTKKLSKKKRREMEMLLFLITHEYPDYVNSVTDFSELSNTKYMGSENGNNGNKKNSFLPTLKEKYKKTLYNMRYHLPLPYPEAIPYRFHFDGLYFDSIIERFEKFARKIQNEVPPVMSR